MGGHSSVSRHAPGAHRGSSLGRRCAAWPRRRCRAGAVAMDCTAARFDRAIGTPRAARDDHHRFAAHESTVSLTAWFRGAELKPWMSGSASGVASADAPIAWRSSTRRCRSETRSTTASRRCGWSCPNMWDRRITLSEPRHGSPSSRRIDSAMNLFRGMRTAAERPIWVAAHLRGARPLRRAGESGVYSGFVAALSRSCRRGPRDGAPGGFGPLSGCARCR
jgi:hypothetical protein